MKSIEGWGEKVKKFINDPKNLIEEMLEGFVLANKDRVRKLEERVIVRKDAAADKVGLVSGGGSGHKPAFIGYLGNGMLDAVAVGDIFSSPSVKAIFNAIKVSNMGRGVLCMFGNYSGDVMNFGMACEMASEEGIDVEKVVVNDDVLSALKGQEEKRRGIAGEVVLWKIAGAKAEERSTLSEVKAVAERVISNTRSAGVAHSPCILPTTGKLSFSIGADEMEIGVGHHGEPGVKRTKMMKADEVTEILTKSVLEDLPFMSNDEVAVIVNGLGSTSLLEMFIVYRKVEKMLEDIGIKIHRTYVGNFFTSQEMGGFSITLTRLDEELKKLLDTPADAVCFVQR
jgi:dihydroxyacetone kinase-like protein